MLERGAAATPRPATLRRIGAVALGFVCAGIAGVEAQTPGSDAGQRYPDVVAVTVRPGAGGTFDFDVTVSSPYD
ncbi:MAG: hypothetical protein IH606_07725, partial [Burkholderiales bacterium]|nr:hypothetical protein [Burkholderiales bacterium]